MHRWMMISWSLVMTACAATVPVPPGLVDLRDETAARAKAEASWARVLAEFVDAHGAINLSKLAGQRQDLNDYVAWLAKCGTKSHPRLFADNDAKLAHYINSYNALLLYGFLELSHSPQDLKDAKFRDKLFTGSKFVIGQEELTLATYRDDYLGLLNEPRINFALHCLARGCSMLANRPYRGPEIVAQLERAAKSFLNTDRYVQVDAEQGKVFVSELMRQRQKDFVNEQYDNSILAYINRYRDPRIPSKYAVEFLPIDWEFVGNLR